MVAKVRFLMVALAMSAATIAEAQSGTLPHFDFKGITATTTLAEATPKLRSVDAYYGNTRGGHLIDDTVNGYHTDVNAVFDEKGLLVMNGNALDYDKTKEAFTLKWGKPSQVFTKPLQNGYGAKINSETVVWQFAEGRMTLQEGGFRGDPSFSYESLRQIEFIRDTNKAKVDF